MVNRYTRLRVRRSIKRQTKTLEEASTSVGNSFDKLVVDRWRNLREVQRFVIGWLVLIALLIGGVFLQSRDLTAYYTSKVSAPGGTFREGMVGTITDINPIFASTAPDRAAASLIFSGLLKYDTDNELTGDLAKSWKVDKTGLKYTIKLRTDAKWHDGKPVTADDVVFTYQLVQHPDTRSFMNASWRDVKIEAKDAETVVFTLPNEFTPFLHTLTIGGILPKHILGTIDPSQIRGLTFNTTQPIGSGPFKYEELSSIDSSSSLLRMSANEDYFLGKPNLDAFIIKTFNDRDSLVGNFLSGEIASAADLSTVDRSKIFSNPDGVWYDMPLNNAVYVFLKNSDPILKSAKVRSALTMATDQKEIARMLDSRYSIAKGPLLSNQIGYDKAIVQKDYDIERANKLLDDEGWVRGSDGVRVKKNVRLSVDLVTQNSDDYDLVARKLREQWRAIGVNLNVLVVNEDDIQTNHIVPHNYQALLFGVTIGSDPDVFPYWHSSQVGVGGFNLSEYSDQTADESLEAGRTRQDPAVRAAKYKAFLEEWRKDAPAIALYQPGFSYVQRTNVGGFKPFRISSPEDRFTNVHKWQINTVLGEKSY